MESNILGETIKKFLGEKIQQRLVVEASDFYPLLVNMGIIHDDEEMLKVFEYLDEAKIDINFREIDSELLTKHKTFKAKANFFRKINIDNSHVKDMMKKVDTIKPIVMDKKIMDSFEKFRNE
jgi:hypothetical protein